MPDIRDMQLLAALARHRHFARAADDCGISQPAFSARIRNMELELDVQIVRRGNRFQGFTEEGEIVLKWARRILSDADGLKQELELARGKISGRLSVGVIPTALAFVAPLPARLRALHPGISMQVFSLTTARIHQGLEDYSLDAGIGYLDGPRPAALAPAELLYEERYVLLAPTELAPRSDGDVTWAEAAGLPLSMLTRDMRNRRFLDEVFEAHVGRAPHPVLETNDLTTLLAQVERGVSAAIVPEVLADSLSTSEDVVRLRLTDPDITTPVGLLLTDRDPRPPAVNALANLFRKAVQ